MIADRIAAAVIALKAPEYTGVGFFLLTVFYAVQIYADFTGGIDMAMGMLSNNVSWAFIVALPIALVASMRKKEQ